MLLREECEFVKVREKEEKVMLRACIRTTESEHRRISMVSNERNDLKRIFASLERRFLTIPQCSSKKQENAKSDHKVLITPVTQFNSRNYNCLCLKPSLTKTVYCQESHAVTPESVAVSGRKIIQLKKYLTGAVPLCARIKCLQKLTKQRNYTEIVLFMSAFSKFMLMRDGN